MTRLSYSKISTFTNCPRSYFLTYIKGVPFKQNSAMKSGIDIHAALAEAAFRDDYKEYLRNHKQYSEFKKQFENYIEYQDMIVSSGGAKPKYIEHKIFDSDLDFSLIIDRVDIFDEKVLLSDIKSDKRIDRNKHDKQLLIYSYFLEKHNKIKVDYIAPFFVTNENSIKAKPVTPEMMAEAMKWLKDNKEDIESRGTDETKYECNPGTLCPWCTHYLSNICKEGEDYIASKKINTWGGGI